MKKEMSKENELKVLILEDIPADAELMVRALNNAGLTVTPKVVDNKEDFERELHRFRPDVILGDYTLPSFSGRDALKMTIQEFPYVPFIFVTATLEATEAVKIIKKGAADFVMKEQLENLPQSVVRALREAEEHRARARIEAELSRLNQELAKRVAQRTQELEAAVEELNSLNYSVSHDLSAPLRIIKGYAALLQKKFGEKLDDEGKNILNRMELKVTKLENLIDDLLMFSRVMNLEKMETDVDLNSLVKDAYNELSEGASNRKIKLAIKEMPPAYGDERLLKQVVNNLVSNAVKYTRRNKVASIEAGGYSKNGENVYYVKDNGVGFDNEYRDKLFKVFNRLHKEKDFEGSGVGLSIVKRIVMRHGGRVWAEGEPEKGAIFYFSLPSKKKQEARKSG